MGRQHPSRPREAGEAGVLRDPAKAPADLAAEALRLHRDGRRVEAVEAYRAALAIAPDYPVALNNLGGVLTELGQLEDALQVFAQFERASPSAAAASFGAGRALAMLGRFEESLPRLSRAVALSPVFPEAHNALGIALWRSGDHRGAIAAFEAALEQRSDFIEAASNLADLHVEHDAFGEALAAIDSVLARHPDHAGAKYKKGFVLALQGDLDAAERLTREALLVHPDYAPAYNNLGAIATWRNDPRAAVGEFARALRCQGDYWAAELGLAHALLAIGDCARGWRHYEARPTGVLASQGSKDVQEARWRGQELPGKTLLVNCEGGLGDVLQFCRLAAIARQRVGRIVLCVHPYFEPLARLLRSIDGVDAVVAVSEGVPPFDAVVSMMSLPYLCDATLDRSPTPVPYIAADPVLAGRFRERLGSSTRMRAGLVWNGGLPPGNIDANAIDRRRSIPLAALAPLLDVPGIEWYSLQKGEASRQAARPPFAGRLVDLTAELGDLADTAALIAQLDLVITVDTSVLHLAGALGKPVWMLNRFDSCWRWGTDRADAPWYPTLRIFRQRRAGEWGPVVADVREALGSRDFAAPLG